MSMVRGSDGRMLCVTCKLDDKILLRLMTSFFLVWGVLPMRGGYKPDVRYMCAVHLFKGKHFLWYIRIG